MLPEFQASSPARAWQTPWLLVFDLDGTLIDSSLDLCLAVNAAMRSVGAPELPHPVIASYIGDGAATLVRRALGSLCSEAEDDPRFSRAFAFFLQFYREHKLDNTRLYPGVATSLAQMRHCAPTLPMAVLTNKPVRPAREICAALGIGRFFFAVYGGDSFTRKKPDPVGLLALMEGARQLLSSQAGGSAAERTAAGVVVIGDSDVDVSTARAAGARVLGCRFGLAPEKLCAAAPDLLCDAAGEWPALLGLQKLERC